MVKVPTQNVALQSAGSLTCKTNRIIAHNLRLCKMLSLQRAQPFSPSPSNRQCSYNLHGQFPNRKPTLSPPPIQGCRKMVQRVSGFIQFLQPLYCFFSAEKFSGNTVAFVTAHSRIPYWRKLLSHPLYFHHTPKTLEFHRQRFVVCLWRVLKIPKQSIFFPPSIPLSLQPLFQAVI